MADEPRNDEHGDEFNRFERLTKQLLAVPKREIDAAVEKAKRERARRPRRRTTG
jgi:ferric-dicitrate binding protein FerR (iron transport regulator)